VSPFSGSVLFGRGGLPVTYGRDPAGRFIFKIKIEAVSKFNIFRTVPITDNQKI
jgi:hypothetical protein